MMKQKKISQGAGNWKGFFRLLGQINLPWLMIAIAFVVDLEYNQVLLNLPTTTASLTSGSLEDSALRDAILFYITYGIVLMLDLDLFCIWRGFGFV